MVNIILKTKIQIFLFIILSGLYSYAQDIVLNELMPSNTTVISDEDGDYPDWLELYNRSTETVNLQDWGLSDARNDLFKWTFPNLSLNPNEFLVLFASGKDRRDWVAYWETIINWGDEWKYYPGSAEPSSNWAENEFNDSNWSSGKSGFGYGDDDDSTDVSGVMSIFIRKSFQIEDLQKITRSILHIDYDDAFVAYLNGNEFARANIGEPGVPPTFDQGADNFNHEAQIYQGGVPELFEVQDFQNLLVKGDNVLAIQVHNHSLTSSDLTCIPFFSIGLIQTPPDPKESPEILNLDAPSLHTNFKISAAGEFIQLTRADGTIEDSIEIAEIPTDYSFGRKGDGEDSWYYFYEATPGLSNQTEGYPALASNPTFSMPGGFYWGSIEISLDNSNAGADIYYSLDGKDPDSLSAKYNQPIPINTTTVVRAKVMGTGLLPSKTITQTYIMNNQSTLPIISISTTPANLWDEDYGIYVLGNDYEPRQPHYGANFWQEWERPAHVDLFEKDGDLAFSIDAGIKIYGGWSRDRSQKSLAVFARGRYGSPSIEYQLFPDRPFNEYTSFVLRNAANDWDRTMFADGMIQNLSHPLDIEQQAYRPCVVYMNGEYFGILNLREKMNEEYLEMHNGVDPNNLDILEFSGQAIEGDTEHYDHLLDFISNNDLSVSENYEYVKTLVDIDNFINYQAFQIYIDNRDWPSNNIKFWRPKTDTGRWRWLLYDTEWGFGINAYGSGGNEYAYTYNTLEFATSPTQTPNHHANPPWSTFLLRSLLENYEFKYRFINRFADFINTIFEEDIMLNEIDSLETLIESEMYRHYEKWRQPVWWSSDILWWENFNYWSYFTQILKDFAANRSAYMISHVLSKFDLRGTTLINLNVVPENAGKIQISTVIPEEYPWKGHYFRGVPITFKTIPSPGYQLKKWTGYFENSSNEITVVFDTDVNITAEFEPFNDLASTVVINEINYNSDNNFDSEDWIELYYEGEEAIDLSQWIFKDSQDTNIFKFPAGSIINSGDFLVICKDTILFKSVFPNVTNFIGNFNFGLSGRGDVVRIYNPQDSLIDSVSYDDQAPWPTGADGSGATLELKNPSRDNSIAESWASSSDHGSPGEENSVYTPIKDELEKIIPKDLLLYQNYPNPFNNVTTIKYQLPVFSQVELSIYNILGQKVSTLVSERQNAGNYQVNWDASGLSGGTTGFASGIYFYRLETDNGFMQTKKLILMK